VIAYKYSCSLNPVEVFPLTDVRQQAGWFVYKPDPACGWMRNSLFPVESGKGVRGIGKKSFVTQLGSFLMENNIYDFWSIEF